MPARYGLIGYPLSHSFSPAYFRKKFTQHSIDATYELFPLEDISQFPQLLKNNPDIAGLNVTTPHKVSILRYLDRTDPSAGEIGAVNCITFKDGVIKGYNTDTVGFEQSLVPLLQSQHKQALILGTGGSSRAVAFALRALGIPFEKVSRYSSKAALTYDMLTPAIIGAHKLIINTTQLGMYPLTDVAPLIPYEGLTSHHLLYDLVYNPAESKFLMLGREKGAVTKNGFEMLQLQAEAGWQIWNS